MMTFARRDALGLFGVTLALLACKGKGLGAAELVNSTDGVSQLMKPSGWNTTTNLNDQATVQIQNVLGDRYAVVLSESKSDLALSGLQEYSDITRGSIRATTTDFSESERTALVINGMNAIQYRVEATVAPARVSYLHTAVEGKLHYHQILAWTTQSKFAANRAELQTVVSSFREK